MKRYALLLVLTTLGSTASAQGYLRDDGVTTYPSGITINEVSARSVVDFNADGTTSTATDEDEFIELVNNSDITIDIGNWQVGDNTEAYTFPSPTLVPPGNAVIVFLRGADISNFNPGGGNGVLNAPAFPAAGALQLSNDNDAVGLRNENNLYIGVDWGTGTLDGSIDGGATLVGTLTTISSTWTVGQSQTRSPDYTGSWIQHPTLSGTVNWSNDSPTVTLNNPQASPGRFNNIDQPLPVSLNTFTGSQQGNDVALAWETESETDNAGFLLYRNGSLIASHRTAPALVGKGSTPLASRYFYTDRNLAEGTLTYELLSQDYSGLQHRYEKSVLNIAVRKSPYRLAQNYPNPFNPQTTIDYGVSGNAQQITLKVFDVLGREMTTLVNEKKAAGNYSVRFNAAALPSGIYFYKLTASGSPNSQGGYTETKKMTVTK